MLLLGRSLSLEAQRPIGLVVKLSRGRSGGRCVGLSSALWKNGRSDPDAIWHHRSDGSKDEADSGISGSVHGKGYFWGEFGARHCNQWDFTAYVCDNAATRPSSQLTLGKHVTCYCYYRLEASSVLHSLWGLLEGVFRLYLPKPQRFG